MAGRRSKEMEVTVTYLPMSEEELIRLLARIIARNINQILKKGEQDGHDGQRDQRQFSKNCKALERNQAEEYLRKEKSADDSI